MQQKHSDNDKALLMASKFSTESLKTIFLQVDRVTACQTLSGSGKQFFFFFLFCLIKIAHVELKKTLRRPIFFFSDEFLFIFHSFWVSCAENQHLI